MEGTVAKIRHTRTGGVDGRSRGGDGSIRARTATPTVEGRKPPATLQRRPPVAVFAGRGGQADIFLHYYHCGFTTQHSVNDVPLTTARAASRRKRT